VHVHVHNRVDQISFRKFSDNAGVMKWAKAQDIRQKATVNNADYEDVTMCQNDL